ncbi:MAG: Na+/H+ antiporter subunit B [Halorhodospira sp.]
MGQQSSLILQTMTRLLLPLQLLFSVFMLLRGHDLPGGGFIAGLVASGGVILFLFAFGVPATKALLRVDPRSVAGVGLLLAVISALPAVFRGQPVFTAQWWEPVLPFIGSVKLSSPLIFDVGVYLTVIGAMLTIVISLAEAEEP